MKIEYVNDLSIYKQIVDNSRNPLESIREFISNSWDVKATEIEISIFYNYETNKIDMIFKNNGQGLDIEEISKLILGAGHSTKTIKDESIGNKGIGTLLYLKCNNITINSKKGNIISKVTWNNPYEFLLDPINTVNDITSQIEEVTENEGDYLQIEMKSYLVANNITKFHHKKVRDYIQRFTRAGTIEKQFDDKHKDDVIIKLKGLEYEEYNYKSYHKESICILRRGSKEDSLYTNIIDTTKEWDIIHIGFKMPNPTTREEIVQLLLKDDSIRNDVGKKNYESSVRKKINRNIVLKMTHELQELSKYKEVEYEGIDSEIKKSELKFVIYKIGQVARETFDDMLETSKRKKSYNENINARYGAFLCKDRFAVCKIDADHLPRLGNGPNGETQYLALFNNDDISLIMDRTAPSIGEDLIEQVYFNIHNAMKTADMVVKEEVDIIKNMLNERLSQETMDKLPLISLGKGNNSNDYGQDKNEVTKSGNNGDQSTVKGPSSGNDGGQSKAKGPSGGNDGGQSTVKGPGGGNNGDQSTVKGPSSGNSEDKYKKEKLEERKSRVIRHKNRKCLTLYNGVKIFDANNEAEVQMELIKIVSISPDILPFDILDYNANRGIDMLAIDKNADREDIDNYYYVELKDKLQSNMNHNMSHIKYILCWEISHTLRKTWKIIDTTGSQYTISKEDDKYIAKTNNHSVKIIELKPLIEKKFNKYFK